MTWAKENADQLLQRLEEASLNNPSFDSPTILARKVKTIGKFDHSADLEKLSQLSISDDRG